MSFDLTNLVCEMKKLLKLGTTYFIYEIIFVTMVFLVLFLVATSNKPFQVNKNCDTVTGSCVTDSNDIKIREVRNK